MHRKISKTKALLLILCMAFLFPFQGHCLESSEEAAQSEIVLHEKPSQMPEKVEVKPKTRDEEISNRLDEILKATNWFANTKVEVNNGVVFLYGETKNQHFKDWAGDLAHHTQDVTAVINKLTISEPSIWDIQKIQAGLLDQIHKIGQALPKIIFGGLILMLAWALARLVYRIVPFFFRKKEQPSLIQELIARTISFFVFLIGVYFIFEMAELTTMALTVLSGTGLMGLILGIAFRDITENFLASVLLSIQNPFHAGDLIDIILPGSSSVLTGYVDRLTLRVTILVTLEGNHLQIPNSTVYKSNIRNYTTNPIHREDFTVSVEIDCSISKAEKAALQVLVDHEAVLKDPEPLVLVDNITKDLVNLRIYYWINRKKYNWLKVRSNLIRLVKQAFQSEKVCLPLKPSLNNSSSPPSKSEKKNKEEAPQTTSETESKHDAQKDKDQIISSQSRLPEQGENLLSSNKSQKEEK